MPLIQNTSADALIYIDTTPTTEAMQAADALIQAQLSTDHQDITHPSIPALRASGFSLAMQTEHDRLISKSEKIPGIDLSRYEALENPAVGDLDAWKATLQHAYASAEYLKSRETNLALLETYGKNAWLVANSQLEDILRDLESEAQTAKRDLESIEQARRSAQENASGEMMGLEQGWRKGVGRMIEAQAAAEGLKQEILQRKRAAAS
ncbi:Pre-mRNA-splicing factor SPF27 [Acrodontium crateriforme]|uniref:Pre-mRNA-splicing factor SPF27 n=1 Tax=Acrodontium crateriforme TaxID=150365 RepID=A0AAQ3M5H2_9PEZI|nr:Pre-mRNA-splicing factor SPF27 [Acrodontium crateriforme]